ncbi:DUF6350 family protein [Kineosporia rhizophila]|uniref:cell division protein PerM n=1 Tax=Kineosporia TaxID=49184 RepID=UPI001E6570B9|nr:MULTISPECIES: DUF6350 family protein [Kineosporia]MCE0536741.1 DUF6350 family protein [Kineosporia rhizophila]GLY13109.1 hypothetical protein Kisp01_01250 [Kineosporia sp. NBRC 101677]
MSTVRERIGLRPGTPPAPVVAGPGRRPNMVLYSAVVAVQAALASLVVVMVPVVLAWATASYSRAPWTDVVQLGIGAWLLGHHVGIVIPDGHIGLVPIGLLLIPVVSCWFGGVRLARGLDPNTDQIREGIGRARPRAPRPKAMAVFAFSYAGTVTAMATLVTTSQVRPLLGQAFAGAMVIVCLAGAAGMAAWVGGGVIPGLRLLVDKSRAPKVIRRCFRPVLLGLAVQLAAALVLFVVATVLGWDRVTQLHSALAPGVVGGIVLTLGQLLVVPNLTIWSGSYAAGAGFSVGEGTTVAPGQLDVGALPALPVLGALPSAPGPETLWLLMAIPVLGGLVTGYRVLRMPLGRNLIHIDASPTRRMIERVPHHVRVPLVRAVVAGLLMVLAWTLLGWLSGGAAGPGRLDVMGPDVPTLALFMAAEAGGAIVLTVAVGLVVRRLIGSRKSAAADVPMSGGTPGRGIPRPARTPAEGLLVSGIADAPGASATAAGTAKKPASLADVGADPLAWLDRPGPGPRKRTDPPRHAS